MHIATQRQPEEMVALAEIGLQEVSVEKVFTRADLISPHAQEETILYGPHGTPDEMTAEVERQSGIGARAKAFQPGRGILPTQVRGYPQQRG